MTVEQEHAKRKLTDLDARLRAFEAYFHMPSDEFHRRYEAGELGDSAEFMEWASFYEMRAADRRMGERLAEEQKNGDNTK
jgi:hypothetical protein